MTGRVATSLVLGFISVAIAWTCVLASDAELYFASDKNGAHRVSTIQEGDTVWIVVADADENLDCDVRDKFWTDVKILDPKTGVYAIWKSYRTPLGDADGDLYDTEGYVPYKGHAPGPTAGWLGSDFLEETGADTGIFVSKRPFQIGSRVSYSDPARATHVVDGALPPSTFLGGGFYYWIDPWNDEDPFRGGSLDYMTSMGLPVPMYTFTLEGAMDLWAEYRDVLHAYFPPPPIDGEEEGYIIGRFENMDTLIGIVQDPNDAGDIAVAMMKIDDVEATIAWDQTVYADGNEAATLTVFDRDENLNCSRVEHVPVFILVNPGSWNPVREYVPAGSDSSIPSPTTFCLLKLLGGVAPTDHDDWAAGDPVITEGVAYSMMWYNIYGSGIDWSASDPRFVDSAYYIEYPTATDDNVCSFDTTDADGFVKVSFHAQETGPATGVFQLNLNSILGDLGFDSLGIRDVLAAYYLDPNDEDDFKLATAYIAERAHSTTTFTDATGAETAEYALGRDAVYVGVTDANANVDPCCPETVLVCLCDPHGSDDSEWVLLDESSSNSPLFQTRFGAKLVGTWDALGVGLAYEGLGGFQLQLDNWKVEAFNEDDILARYNDVVYERGEEGMGGIGDADTETAFPPRILRARVENDVSFDLVSVSDTQVFDGTTTQMRFLDRQGDRVSGYASSDCVFIEVVDSDQNEDARRRERIDGYWDGGQNAPFGPVQLNEFGCVFSREGTHPLNALLGDTNIFNDAPVVDGETYGLPKLYVLNPRNGRWAATDLLETGVATGDFVSVTCIDLVDVYECVPTLGVLPGDTIVAFYQDPSNHSDNAMISIKVGIGGGGMPPTQASTTMFVDADGNDVANYTDADLVYVKIIDPSHTGASLLANAIEIDGATYDVLHPEDAGNDEFMTAGLDLGLAAGSSITATYTDPTDPTDTSSDTITVIASVLEVVEFYAGPSPFEGECTFGYIGTGTASVMTVEIYDLAGALVWASELTDVTEIVWNGTDMSGASLANGAYLYKVTATDGMSLFATDGIVFLAR